jgi:hypothetical protein
MKSRLIILFFICVLLAGAYPVHGQLVQPARLELELGDYEDFYTVVSAGDKGLFLYRKDEDLSTGLKGVYEVLCYDADLQERWSTSLEVEEASLTGYEYKSGKLYLLFREPANKADNYHIYRFDLETSLVSAYTIDNAIPIELTEFTALDDVMLLGGYVNYRPAVIYYDLKADKYRVIPGLYMNHSELLEIKPNEENNTFSILYTERIRNRQQTISTKTFDRDGSLIFEYRLRPDPDRNLLYGRTTSTFTDNGLHLAGTYSHGNTKFSRGIFIANVQADGSQDIQYYNYGDLQNFFSYMKAKRENRIRKRIQRRKVKGKKIKLNYKLLVHNIIEQKEGNILLGEAFYPKYASQTSYSNFSAGNFTRYNRGYTANSSANLEGYQYTHAVLIGFDKTGNLTWDNSFEINDVMSPVLKKYVQVLPFDDCTVLLYMYENVVRSKIIHKEEVLEGKSTEEIATLYEDDEVRRNDFDMGGLEQWYGPWFYAYGVQRIRNRKDSAVKPERKVFFINKITYHPQDGQARETSKPQEE